MENSPESKMPRGRRRRSLMDFMPEELKIGMANQQLLLEELTRLGFNKIVEQVMPDAIFPDRVKLSSGGLETDQQWRLQALPHPDPELLKIIGLFARQIKRYEGESRSILITYSKDRAMTIAGKQEECNLIVPEQTLGETERPLKEALLRATKNPEKGNFAWL